MVTLGRDEISSKHSVNGYQNEIQDEWCDANSPHFKYYHELKTPEGRHRLLTLVENKLKTATSNPRIKVL